MSRVYFHSPSGEAELRGSERAYAGGICNDLALLVLRHELRPFGESSPLRAWLPPDSYVLTSYSETNPPPRDFATGFEQWFNVSFSERGLVDPRTGDEYTPFRVSLNTAIAMGSDPVRLLARIHGQCEIHGWVDGPDRQWLAEIIDEGVTTNIYHPNAGWPDVSALLRQRDDEPVVMSYSVTESFPNRFIVEEAGIRSFSNDGQDGESWYDLPDDDRWKLAEEALRATHYSDWQLRLDPETFAVQGFGDGRSAFDIIRAIHAEVPA